MNKLYIGARVRIIHLNSKLGSDITIVMFKTETGRWKTNLGYYINEDCKTIRGIEGLLATVELLNPIKRYKYKKKK